jgi:3-methylfumaryl-CoA hydratase
MAPATHDHSHVIEPTPTMLFRYSALTFNGHRIHYDVDYARTVEGYDGLVFHGPLTATLLVALAERISAKPISRFEFRGLAPLTGQEPFTIHAATQGDSHELWAKRSDGAVAMTADAR